MPFGKLFGRQEATSPIICVCNRVRRDTIIRKIGEGCTTIAELQRKVKVCDGCTGCEIELEELLAQFGRPR